MTRVLTQLSASLASTYLHATLRCLADYQAELQIMLQSADSGVWLHVRVTEATVVLAKDVSGRVYNQAYVSKAGSI